MDTESGELSYNRILSSMLRYVSEMFTTICTIKGDTTGQKLVKRFNEQGEPYWVQDYDIILNFGLTELTAELAWVEKVRIVWIEVQNVAYIASAGRGKKVFTSSPRNILQ